MLHKKLLNGQKRKNNKWKKQDNLKKKGKLHFKELHRMTLLGHLLAFQMDM